MPELDPITQDAMRRAAQMRNHNTRPRPPAPEPKPEPNPEPPTEKHREPPPKPPKQPHGLTDGLGALFRDKEQSIILLLIVLLMDENCEPSLLLALMYLLI